VGAEVTVADREEEAAATVEAEVPTAGRAGARLAFSGLLNGIPKGCRFFVTVRFDRIRSPKTWEVHWNRCAT
jgi:hypothetical protein